jgi:hypothetical protein
MFLKNAFANFLGSLAAAVVVWWLVTRVYEVSRSKRSTNELLAISYALIKREIDAASQWCKDHVKAGIDELSASGPITQAWETLHSMEAFKYFSPTLSEKLVKYYSLLFRLKANVELEQNIFASHGVPLAGADPMAGVLQTLRGLENEVCSNLLDLEARLQPALDHAVSMLGKREKAMFAKAYEKQPVSSSDGRG